MRTTLLTVFLGVVCHAAAEVDPPMSWVSALPLQAAVCDLVGIGRILSKNSTNAIVQVDQCWFGGTNDSVMALDNRDGHGFPTNGTPIVFFASRYTTFLELEPLECHYAYILDMDHHRSQHQPDGLYLYDGERSWFPATTNNADVISFCSNLVYVAQVNTNLQAFYELIRDGYRLHPEPSRIRRDSEFTFMHCGYFMTTEYMQQIWTDPLLVGEARDWVNMEYQRKTKSWLP
jgi:hypothetical protein